MNQLNEQQLQEHVPIAGWLLIVYSILNMIGGLVVFALIMSGSLFWTQLGAVANDPEGTRIFSMFTTLTVLSATIIGLLVVGLAIPALVAGIGLLARKAWARVFGVILSVFILCVVPVGTIIGVYTIFVLMQDAARSYFASPPARMQATPRPM